MGGKGMVVGNEEIAVVFILHFDKVAQSAEIVTEVQVASGADAAAHDFTLRGIGHRHRMINELHKQPGKSSTELQRYEKKLTQQEKKHRERRKEGQKNKADIRSALLI